MTTESAAATGLRRALTAESSSARLEAALAAGTHPQPEYVDVLIERCAIETDFYVREMLTWALTRHDADEGGEAGLHLGDVGRALLVGGSGEVEHDDVTDHSQTLLRQSSSSTTGVGIVKVPVGGSMIVASSRRCRSTVST